MDKNKIIEAAAKLVAKGAYDKAIKEYQKVLDADAKDVRVLQKMGELYQKKNENAQAAHYFTKVAESYSADGFFLKAVALYKQVLKLNPNLLDVNIKLAELHQQLGLMSEAMAYFQIVANHHDKAGDVRNSLDTLKRMVDLDPENVASKIKLAELYARENMTSEATQEFKRAAEYLKRNSRMDDWLRVAERLSTLEPDNVALARELAQQYLARSDQKRALAKLQVCFKADGRDVETLNMLAQAFHGLGQTGKTVSVYKELAKVYQERGRVQDAQNVWERIEALEPGDPDLLAHKASTAPAPAPAAPSSRPVSTPAPAPAAPSSRPVSTPAPAPAPAAPVRAAPAPAAPAPAQAAPTTQSPFSKLLTETEVYVKYGLHDKALEHLRKIFAVDPENLDAHEKAYHIYIASGNMAQASEQLLNVLRLCTRRAEVERAQPYLSTILQESPGHPEVPAFLAVLRADTTAEQTLAAPVETVGEDAILVDSNDEEIIVADAPEDALAQPPGDELALVTASRMDHHEEIVADDSLMGEAIVSDEFGLTADSEAEEGVVLAEDEPLYGGDEDSEEATRVFMAPDSEGELLLDEPGVPLALEDEPPRRLEEAFDQVPGFEDEGALELEAPSQAAPVAQVEEPEEEPAAEECDEASFFLDQGLYEEAREILETVMIAFPGHARATELMARLDALESGGAPPEEAEDERGALPAVPALGESPAERDAFDLAAELAGEFGDLGEEPAPAPVEEDFQYSVDEVFAEFKKGLAKVVKPEDVDTHYDLGIAYREMGLVDDALNEFSVAREGCLGKKREVDCLTMIGVLQFQKGEPGAAVDTFKQALASEHATGEVAKALGFELAMAYEAMGEGGKALYHFQRVAVSDPRYRDVSGHVERLSATTFPEDDPLPTPGASPAAGARMPVPAAAGTAKPRKVGYV